MSSVSSYHVPNVLNKTDLAITPSSNIVEYFSEHVGVAQALCEQVLFC